MTKCAVTVTIDGWVGTSEEPPTFEIGQPITGAANVWVHEPMRCDGLDVWLEMKPTAPGFAVGPGIGAVRLFAGDWAVGEYDYRFSIPSTGPPTHQGKHVGWKWRACVRADVPWAIDAAGEAEFCLVLPREPRGFVVIPPAPDESDPAGPDLARRAMLWTGGLFTLALAAFGIGLTMQLLGLASEDITGAVAGIGFTLAILLGGGLGAQWFAWKSRGGASSGSAIRLTYAPASGGYRAPASGEPTLRCEVKTRPGGAEQRVVAHLVVHEHAEWRSGTGDSKTTHVVDHELYRSTTELASDPGRTDWAGDLALPTLGTVPCFTHGVPAGHGLVWRVDVMVHPKSGAEAAKLTRLLTVRPE